MAITKGSIERVAFKIVQAKYKPGMTPIIIDPGINNPNNFQYIPEIIKINPTPIPI